MPKAKGPAKKTKKAAESKPRAAKAKRKKTKKLGTIHGVTFVGFEESKTTWEVDVES